MNGKGDKRRPGDTQKYRENHDRIFKKEGEWTKSNGGTRRESPGRKGRQRGKRSSTA